MKDAEDSDDIWDDTLLIKAYDESVKLGKEEVARRVAMSTNRRMRSEGDQAEEQPMKFEVGSLVRSTYEDVDYEAEILKIEKDGSCLIKYFGYDNEETVQIESLVISWGNEARNSQISQAKIDQEAEDSEDVDQQFSNFHQYIQNKSKKINSSPSIPNPPMPPMPPGMFDNGPDSEHMSAMLMSWYMSGYYTGLYYGKKQEQEKQQVQETQQIQEKLDEPMPEIKSPEKRFRRTRKYGRHPPPTQ